MENRVLFLLKILILTVIFIINSSCGGGKSSKPEIIFLITLDTTRADYFDYRLSDNQLTPNFARLASEGSYFQNAYANIPITLPSHAVMFYSLPAHRLKIYNNGQTLETDYLSLVQILKSHGFHTGAVISLGVLKTVFGLNKGFDHYVENFKSYLWIKKAEDVNRDAFELIKKVEKIKSERGDFRSFYWIHYSDPHEPYFPPANESKNSGKFLISLNGETLFTCQSTEQAVVNLDMNFSPGENLLRFQTKIPPIFNKYKDCQLKYLKYRDFSIKPLFKKLEVKIMIPDNWIPRKVNQSINYYSNQLDATCEILNKSHEIIRAKLHFYYSLHVDDLSRKRFYGEEIKYMDKKFGKLLVFLKKQQLYKKSAFIIMGDHGEGLGEYRGHFGHIHYLNKLYSRVPLIMAGPGIPKRGECQEPVSNLNLAPTILQLANISKPDFMLGQSLLKFANSNKILLETYSPEAYFDCFSLIDYPWQIIFNPGRKKNRLEFINLADDSLGIINLNQNKKMTELVDDIKVAEIKSNLVNAILKISRIITATKGKVDRQKRYREILKSLGYL